MNDTSEVKPTSEKPTRQQTEPDPVKDPVSWIAWHRAQTRVSLALAHLALEKRRAALGGNLPPPPVVFKDHPIIAISRQHKQVAIFDGTDTVVPFKDYQDEEAALREAIDFLARNGWTKKIEVVYPAITSMTMSTSSRRPRRKR